MTPAQARELALQLLQARGLERIAANDRGDSFYLARSGMTATIRVSSHARTPKQRRTHPEVVTSLVIRESRSAAQVERMVAVAAATYEAAIRAIT